MLGEGDSFTQKLRLAGKSFKVDWTVDEADPPRVARWTGDGPAGSTAKVTYRLAEEDGGTRFDYENEFALPGGVLGKAAGGLLSAAPGAREARKSLERLRSLLDAPDRPTTAPSRASGRPSVVLLGRGEGVG